MDEKGVDGGRWFSLCENLEGLPWFLVNAGKSLFCHRPCKSTNLLPFDVAGFSFARE